MSKNIPKFMITYLCNDCGNDFAVTEEQKSPTCFYCERKNYKEIKRQKLSAKVMTERLKLVTDRMMENLQKAYQIGREEGFINDNAEETIMLDTLSKAQKLQKGIRKLKMKKEGKKPRQSKQ